MRFVFLLAVSALAMTGCTTPTTTLKHPKTGQVATCGGETAASIAGGAIGYSIQKDNDEKCVQTYQKQGFDVIGSAEEKAAK